MDPIGFVWRQRDKVVMSILVITSRGLPVAI